MIYCLTGKIIKKTMNAVVVSCGGVGYYAQCPASVAGALPGVGKETTLYTVMSVTENDVSLYGFATEEQQACFEMLTAVSGVGPKVGLAILSVMEPQRVALAISAGDHKAFKAASGVGPKLAQRIVLELKDKVAKGFVDGMLDGTIPESEYKHYLGVVSQETGRLARLVQNMLDITKLESGEVKGTPKNYDIWSTVTDVVLSDERRIEDGKIDIQGLGPTGTMVYADPDFIHQVVYNIVDNAIKFTPPDGVIKFDIQQENDMVRVTIENTGDGIAPDALPFVFERFYKEDRSRGLNTRGSGLGLHICKVLITLSGGQIKAESEMGKWCRFTFTLPAGKTE